MDDNFHKSASISDKITALGELEHVLYHSRKSASVKMEDKELETFFQTVASMALDFRRRYMKKHFPNCPEELWCLGKAVETARQRIYEADEGDTEDLNDIDAIWSYIWGKITGEDLSGCSSCREDSAKSLDPDEASTTEPLDPDEANALFIGENKYLVTGKIYLVSVAPFIVPGQKDPWSVTVYDSDGNVLTSLNYYNGPKSIYDDWKFTEVPRTLVKDKE